MARRKLGFLDIIVGQPLPWNIFNSEGTLLLRKGEKVATETAVKRLVAEGLYSDISDVNDIEEMPIIKNEPSVVRILNRANWLLRKSLPSLAAFSDPPSKIKDIASLVYSAVELDSDVAVACIFLNQKPGHETCGH